MFSSFGTKANGSNLLDAYTSELGNLARQRRAEQALKATQEQAESLAKAVRNVVRNSRIESDYLINMSYELRNLLNAVMGFSAMMRSESHGPVPDAYKEYAHDIHSSGMDILSVLEEYNDKAEGGAVKQVNEEPLDLAAAIRDAYQAVHGYAQEKQVNIQARLARDLPGLCADPGALNTILVDMIGEAVHRSPASGIVDVVARLAKDGRMAIQVINTRSDDAAEQEPTVPVSRLIAGGTIPDTEDRTIEQLRIALLAESHGANFGASIGADNRRVAMIVFPVERVTQSETPESQPGAEAPPAT